jgi:predicted nucleic acid-binding Zn ribbon protein
MAFGLVFRCNECGEKFNAMRGVGMLFTRVYKKTVVDIRCGEYGKDWKKFFEEHPDGVVNCEKELLICEECGVPKNEMNLSLYLPKEGEKDLPKYLFGEDLKEKYALYDKYPHKCDRCGGGCNIVDVSKISRVTCPECGGELENNGEFVIVD